ncbi:hypothetical protein ANANG_G00320110 [Anguilla anguilla]|uniref:Uncharacterized protein n=1 Tax=Anguilla anguilla TaxID=7936 RepID=A0A9D3RHK1_ANGAN|nr:hypothetical protein ANANG_G00320110 [Anguilla anguilla]
MFLILCWFLQSNVFNITTISESHISVGCGSCCSSVSHRSRKCQCGLFVSVSTSTERAVRVILCLFSAVHHQHSKIPCLDWTESLRI